jgi:hypothetical protein
MRTCTYCGKDNEVAASFCAGCGDSLDNSSHAFPVLSDEKRRQRVVFAWAGFVVGMAGTGIVTFISLPFFFVPHGSGIRPMGWAAAVLLLAGGTFLVGLPCSMIGTTSNKRWIGWLGVPLSIAPGPLGFAMLHIAMAIRGFVLEP